MRVISEDLEDRITAARSGKTLAEWVDEFDRMLSPDRRRRVPAGKFVLIVHTLRGCLGRTSGEIADLLGVPEKFIDAAVFHSNPAGPRTEDVVQSVHFLRSRGMNIGEIAQTTGLTPELVYEITDLGGTEGGPE